MLIDTLPAEVALQIFALLDEQSICRLSQVSSRVHFLADDDSLWAPRCRSQQLWGLDDVLCPPEGLSWKSLYMQRRRLARNWRRGSYSVHTLLGHTESVVCIQLRGTLLVSGSYDGTIRMFDVDTGKCIQLFSGHSEGVRCIQFDESILVSGSIDATIKVWNVRDGTCLATLRGHNSVVRCLSYYGDVLASGSVDKSVRLWSLSEQRPLAVLHGHSGFVYCVLFDGSTIYSGSFDRSVKIWCETKRRCIKTLIGHSGWVMALELQRAHRRLISGSVDGSIIVWSTVTFSCIGRLGGSFVLRCLRAVGDRIVYGCDSSVAIESLHSATALHSMQPHAQPPGVAEHPGQAEGDPGGPEPQLLVGHHLEYVTALDTNDGLIASASTDRTIKIWDFR